MDASSLPPDRQPNSAVCERSHDALDELVPALYDDLRRTARRQLRCEEPTVSLNTTSLVHDAYVRLAAAHRLHLENRSHFLAVATRLMRRILIDHARSHQRGKRGAGMVRAPLEDAMSVARERPAELVRLDDCLDALAHVDARKAQVVRMRFFGGLTVEETAAAIGVSADTVERDWRLSRAWLIREMRRRGDDVT